MDKFYFENWTCDPTTLLLSNGESEFRLERKVMAVLVLLLRNSQRVVTNEEIFQTVWQGVVVGDNSLHRTIAIIRKTLGDNPKKPVFIESIPRQGYRFKLAVEHSSQVAEPPGRLPVIIRASSKAHGVVEENLLRVISRLISGYSPALRVLRKSYSDETAYVIDIDVTLGPNADRCFNWEVLRGPTQEVVSSGQHREAHDQIRNKIDQVIELIANASAADVIRHWVLSLKRLQSSGNPTYWDCIMSSDRYQYMDGNHLKERKEFLRLAIEKEPRLPYAFAAYADYLSWAVANGVTEDPRSDASQAREIARKALEIESNDPYTLSRCGRAFSRIGDLEAGVHLCRQAAEMAPSATNKLFLGDALTFAGEAAEALEVYSSLLSGTPSGRNFQYGRIVVPMVQLGMFEEGLAYAKLATVHFPRDYFCWTLRANLEATLGDGTSALQSIRSARSILPSLDIDRLVEGTIRTYAKSSPDHAVRLTDGLKSLDLEG